MPALRISSSLAARSRFRSGGDPNAASSFDHIDRAAATLTCCPTIVRSKVWAPRSLLRGAGMPCRSTTRANAGSRLASSSTWLRMLAAVLTMAARGIECDCRRIGDIETLDRVADREPRKCIAMLARIGPEARTLGTEHQCDAQWPERLLEIGFGTSSEADAPEP